MTRVFSGIQPSGELHIGNYLGAVQNWVQLQHQHECLFSIVDLHAITQSYDVPTLAQRTLDMAVGLYASGLDPEQCIVFVQSHVAQHSELNWLLTIVTPLGELERRAPVLHHFHDPPGLLAGGDASRGRAQMSHGGLGLPRLQTRVGGQYDSGAHTHPRAGRGAEARARGPGGAVAGRRGEGARARPRDARRSARPDGIPQARGAVMLDSIIDAFKLELMLQLGLT